VMEKAGMTFDERRLSEGKDTVFFFALRPGGRPV